MSQPLPNNKGLGNPTAPAAAQFDLERFVKAQNARIPGSSRTFYEQALEEMKTGQKRGHWIWYTLPMPLFGTTPGPSQNTLNYSLKSRTEAKAYIGHKILGERLRTIVQAAIDSGASWLKLLPRAFDVDRPKFHSCLTLFATIDFEDDVYLRALGHFKLQPHEETVDWLLQQAVSPPSGTPTAHPPSSSSTNTSGPGALNQSEPTIKDPSDDDDNDIGSYGSDRSNDGEWEEFELEAIVDSRYRKRVLQYRVRWKQDQNDKRWYSAKNLRQAPLILDEFHKANPMKEGPPKNIDTWIFHYFRGKRAPRDLEDNRRMTTEK